MVLGVAGLWCAECLAQALMRHMHFSVCSAELAVIQAWQVWGARPCPCSAAAASCAVRVHPHSNEFLPRRDSPPPLLPSDSCLGPQCAGGLHLFACYFQGLLHQPHRRGHQVCSGNHYVAGLQGRPASLPAVMLLWSIAHQSCEEVRW